MAEEEELRVCSTGGKPQEPRGGRCAEPGPAVTAPAIPLQLNCLSSLSQPANSLSGRRGAESQDRMRDSSACSSASSSVTDLYCTPSSRRAHLFFLSTAGYFSLSASLSACMRLYEVPSNRVPFWAQKSLGSEHYFICFASSS